MKGHLLWPKWGFVLQPWNVINDVCIEHHVLNTLNVSVTKRKQLPVCRHSVMLCTAWCLRLSVTSHELSAVICSLQVGNWTSAFTLRVNVRLRRFFAFICGFVTEGFIFLDSVPVEWILRVYWLGKGYDGLGRSWGITWSFAWGTEECRETYQENPCLCSGFESANPSSRPTNTK